MVHGSTRQLWRGEVRGTRSFSYHRLVGSVRRLIAISINWLNRGAACWLGTSTAARLALWLAAGIIVAEKLALPPYLTWLAAALWWGASCLRLLLGGSRLRQAALIILCGLAGAASFSSYWHTVDRGLSSLTEVEGPAEVVAQVIGVSYNHPFQRRVTVEIRGIVRPEGVRLLRGRAVLTQAAEGGAWEEVKPGSVILAKAKFSRPRRASNPGQFDYAAYLYRRGISLTAFAEGAEAVQLLESDHPLVLTVLPPGPLSWISAVRLRLAQGADSLRQRLAGVWDGRLPPRHQGLVAAMAFGDDTGLDEDLERAFRRTGQAHLLSVSGLHVGFVTGWVWYLGRSLPGGQVVKPLVGMMAAWGYALIAGAGPPVVRAAAALSLYLVAAALNRKHDPLAAAAWAAVLQLMGNPSLIFDISFQLSYGALLGILVLAQPLEAWLLPKGAAGGPLARTAAKAAAPMVISASAQLAILPLLSCYFQELPLLGPLLGLAAVPAVGLIVPLALLGSLAGLAFPVQFWLAPILRVLLTLLDELLCLCSTWSWAVVYTAAGPVILWAGYYLALTALALYLKEAAVYRRLGLPGAEWGKIRRRLILAGLLAGLWMFYMPLLAPLWRPLEITFLDVGQGDAVYISTPSGRHLLIDGGGLPSSLPEAGFDVGERIVLPFLKHRGVRRLDLVVATHFHNDHTQGLRAVLRELPVALLADNGLLDSGFASRQYGELLEELGDKKAINRITMRRGQRLHLSRDIELVVLHPPAAVDLGRAGKGPAAHVDQNNSSVVLKLLTPHYSALFTGDIDREAQAELVQHHMLLGSQQAAVPPGGREPGAEGDLGDLQERFRLSADILKVPHHGSRKALVYSFLGAVSPKQAVISVGSNPHGHPAPEFLQALEMVTGDAPLRTDQVGCITLKIWGKRMVIDTFLSPSPWEVGRWRIIQRWETRLKNVMGRA